MAEITKAVILTAGLGTRFYPVTKSIPKAMLPVVDKPIIQLLVEEVLSAGIKEIIIVIGPGQEAVKDYFTPNEALHTELEERGKTEQLELIKTIESQAKYHFVVQEEAKGDGHALLQAEQLLEGEDFALLFGDELIDHEVSALNQLLNIYKKTGTSIIGSQEVDEALVCKYGIIAPSTIEAERVEVKGLVEKPSPEEAPSNYAVIGKYICKGNIFDHIKESSPTHSDGEIRLIDAFLHALSTGEALHACLIKGKRFDTGSKKGLLEANQYFAQQ